MSGRPAGQRRGASWAGALLGAVLLAATPWGGPAAAEEKGSLPRIEEEFKAAIRKVAPSTVRCLPVGAPKEQDGSSGVIVSRRGLVLSDGDAGTLLKVVGEGRQARLEKAGDVDDVEVRVPDPKSGFKAYRARVLRRDHDVDTTLLRIVDPPSSGFPGFLSAGSSDDLRVGDFLFAMGNAFSLSAEGTPSLTSGVVSALVPLPSGHDHGRYELLYTSAAVNPGVNGGPLVDVEGRLVGTVSTFMLPLPKEPFQFLGRGVPVQRLRRLYADLPEAAEAFPEQKPVKARSTQAAALEATFAAVGEAGYPFVASLTVERSAPYQQVFPAGGAPRPVPCYQGPMSAVVVGADGTLATSLYNLTNLFTLVHPGSVGEAPPPALRLSAGLETITGITVHLSDGRSFPGRLAGVHERHALAVIRVDLPPGTPPLAVPTPAPAADLVEGRFAVSLGNPFGARPAAAPLLAVGILSKQHAATAAAAWRGWWQTDAGVSDANCGGALLDLRGRLLGLLHLWSPMEHGRVSGIGFALPAAELLEAVRQVTEGRAPRRGYLGVSFAEEGGVSLVQSLVADAPGARGGLLVRDRISALDGEPVRSLDELIGTLRFRWEGETVRLTVERSGGKQPLELPVVLGGRPDPSPPAPPPQAAAAVPPK